RKEQGRHSSPWSLLLRGDLLCPLPPPNLVRGVLLQVAINDVYLDLTAFEQLHQIGNVFLPIRLQLHVDQGGQRDDGNALAHWRVEHCGTELPSFSLRLVDGDEIDADFPDGNEGHLEGDRSPRVLHERLVPDEKVNVICRPWIAVCPNGKVPCKRVG